MKRGKNVGICNVGGKEKEFKRGWRYIYYGM
jgi:hypothetical protein